MLLRMGRFHRGWALLVAIGLAGGMGATAGAARGEDFRISDDPVHLDELAGSLLQVSNALCWEMHRYHRQQPDFSAAYRPAKEIWTMAGALRDGLRSGPVDDRDVVSQVAKMNELFATIEKTCAGWGDGIRSANPAEPVEERAVVVPGSGVDVDIPLLFGGGIRVGRSPRMVVAEPAVPAVPRRAFHPNARGSKRSLERELASVRTALGYLTEDSGAVPPNADSSAPNPPRPMPPDTNADKNSGPALAPPTKIVPSANRK